MQFLTRGGERGAEGEEREEGLQEEGCGEHFGLS